jgi:predicted PurR-regulated permease PerM
MNNHKLFKIAAAIFIISIFFLLIILAKDVLIPFAVSFFFAYLLYPLVWKLERRGLHRGLAIIVVMLAALLILGSAALFLSIRLSNVDIDLGELKEQVDTKSDSLLNIWEKKLGLEGNSINGYLEKSSEALFSSGQSTIGGIFSTTTTTLFQLFIMPVFIFFLLFYRTKTAHFILMLTGRRNKRKALQILREISTVTTKYMAGLLVVIFILAVLNTVGLIIIGVPNALFFGVLAALLNLIPYIGTFIGGLLPILYVLFTDPDPLQTMFQVFILFSVVQFLENNILTPNIVGNNIKINPLAIILGLLLANMVWGVAGMLIVVPCLAIMKIVMRNIDELKPFEFLISDKGVEKYEVDFTWFRKLKNKLFKRNEPQ